MLAPVFQLGLLLYVLLPLRLGRVPWQLPHAFRLLRHAQTWSMIEVFMIGILVAITKLMGMASIVPGLALWSFALLMLVLAARDRVLRPGSRVGAAGGAAVSAPPAHGARAASCASCHDCGLLVRGCPRAAHGARCARCGAALHAAQAAQPRAHLGARDRGRALLRAGEPASR